MPKYRVTYQADETGAVKTSSQVAATPEAAEAMVRLELGHAVKILETRKMKG